MGTVRLALSLLVVASHLGGMGDSPAGGTAVAAFFTISGFLMARTIQENYSNRAGRFYLNRLVRLAPPLVVALGATALLLWVRDSQGFRVSLTGPLYLPVEFPTSPVALVEWKSRGLPNLLTAQLHLVPQGWSLLVEGVFYLLAPALVALAASGQYPVLWAAAIVSCGLAVASTFAVGDLDWLRSPTSSVWVFILGVLAYFRARSATHEAAHTRRALALVAVAAVMAMGLGATAFPTGVVLLLTPLVVVTWLMWGGWSSRASGPIDRELGRVAYGVFIGHFLSAMLMLWAAELVHSATGVFGVFGTADQELLHLSAYVASLLGGVLIYRLVERPFESLRTTIRQRPAQ